MKAVVINRFGGNNEVAVRDVPVPVPGQGDVMVKVQAAGVNPVDWKVRSGQAKIFTGSRFPMVLGCECAGIVAATGAGARRFRIGDRVVLYGGVKRLGAFAEFACAGENSIYPAPDGVPFEQAACVPIAGLTALQALRDHGKIAPGKKVLVNGASGGVGHFAVQIAKSFGAQITAVTSGGKAELVRGLGADAVVDYTHEDFTLRAERYDLIFDAVSSRSFFACRKVLARKGVYVNTLPNATIFAQILTSALPGRKARSMWVKPDGADADWMLERLRTGMLRVVIDRTFPLDHAADALAYSEGGRVAGKVVLVMA